MTANSFNELFRSFGNSGSARGPRRALTLSVALLTNWQLLAMMPSARAADAATPVQQATRAAALVNPNTAAPKNPHASSPGALSNVSAPQVPSSTSIVTSSVATNLASVVNAPSLLINVGSLQNGVYNVAGDFVNTNNLIFFSTNSHIHTATLAAGGRIFNPVGASISTVVPTGVENAVSNLNLVLISPVGIYNAGSIVSAGSLTMTAPTIANALPSGLTGPAPVMQALSGNLAMQTSTLLNQGVIAAATGNINIANLSSNLAVNALGGSFNAAGGLGTINIGTQSLTEQLNLQVLGGDYLAKALNLTAGTSGLVSMQVNSLSGAVNVTAADAYIGCNTGTLTLGNILVGGDPYTTNGNGDIVFTGVTDVANISLYTPDSVLSDGASSILSQTTIVIEAGKNIDLSGVSSITSSGNIDLVADSGYISIPGVHIASNGGNVSLVAYGDVNLADANNTSQINTSAGAGPGGRVFVASQTGNVNLGAKSQITTGALAAASGSGMNGAEYAVCLAAYGGLTVGNITAPGGDIVISSGVQTTGSASQGFIVHNFDGSQQGFSSGGITAGVLDSHLNSTGTNSILYANATNGSMNLSNVLADGGSVTLLTTGDLTIEQGVNNTSKAATGGTVIAAANTNLQIGTGIVNDAPNGSGGTVSVSAGMDGGLTVGAGGLTISNNAGTNGGTVSVSNFGPLNYQGGVQAKAGAGNGTNFGLATFPSMTTGLPGDLNISAPLTMSNATANGHGGSLQLSSAGDINMAGVTVSANGSGSGNGSSLVQITASGNLNAAGATVTADGGSNGSGGVVGVLASSYSNGGGFKMSANGNGAGNGGSVTFYLMNNSGSFDSGDLFASATGANGGSVTLMADSDLTVNTAVYNVSPLASGNGGNITLSSAYGTLSVTGDVNADALGYGNGGTINLSSGGSNFALGSGSSRLFARGGTSGGNGGSITVNAGGDLSLAKDAVVNVDVRGFDGDGGTVVLASGYMGPGSLTVNCNLNASGAGTGRGGVILLQAESGAINLNGNLAANAGAEGPLGGTVTLNMMSGYWVAGPAINVNGNISVDALAGVGGSIWAYSSGPSNPINLGTDSAAVTLSARGSAGGGSLNLINIHSAVNLKGGSSLLAGSQSGNGGTVLVSAGANLTISSPSTEIDASSAEASGGQITLEAGTDGPGQLSIRGSVTADGTGAENAAGITFSQNSTQAMQIGVSGDQGVVSAVNDSGNGGSLTLISLESDLTVLLNQAVTLQGSSVSEMGYINASSTGNVSVSGPGTLTGAFKGSGVSYSVLASGASNIGVKFVAATGGNVTVKATQSTGSIYFLPGATMQSAGGSIEIGAPTITFGGAATLSMDNAGILKVNSGNQASALTMNFSSGTVSFNVDQGASLRPGTVAIGPTGNGSLTFAGSGTVNFSGGTVSLSSSGGPVNLGGNLTLNSDAFDTTQNLGMEIIASGGDINLGSQISARQLNVATLGSGNINLAAEINSPTVTMSVQGASSINQVGKSSIGIGTLVLNSATGNIGSAANPINANVLELQVSSSGSVYVNNASTVDLKTSTVAGTFQLNNEGDITCENNVSAGNLKMTATNGNIFIYSPTAGTYSLALTTTGTGSQIAVQTGAQLSSASGNITLNTDNLVLDGSVLAQAANAQVVVNSGSNLKLSGAAAQISTGAGGFINLVGSNSVSFASSYIMNAGSNGLVQIQTSNAAGSGVTLGAGAKLTAAGGSQLNVYTSQMTFAGGSSVSLSNPSIGMSVQSTAGLPLTVNVGGSLIPIATAGGSVQFVAGTGGSLTFQAQTTGTYNLSVSGGTLATSSSAADTTLSHVNLLAGGNIQITVSAAKLNLNGNSLTCSKAGAVIVLQDPDSIAIVGGGTIGFSQGVSGSIMVEAMSPGADLQIAGSTLFSPGAGGSVSFDAAGSLTFAEGSTATVSDGAQINLNAPIMNFGSQSQLVATGASSVSLTSPTGLTVVLGGNATISTNGGSAITISAAAGSPVTFSQSSGSSSTLSLTGAPVTVSTANANVTIESNVVLNSNNNVSVLTPGGTLINNGQIVDPNPGTVTYIQAAGNLLINKNVTANDLVIETTANNGTITLSADVTVLNSLTVSANGSGNIYQTCGLLTAASISLVSQSGQIGSATGAIQVKAADLNVSTRGAAYVNARGPVRLDSYNAGGGLHLSASGNISIGAANANKVSITSSGYFDAGRNGTVTISATSLVSFAPDLAIRVKESALNVNAAAITIGQGTRIRSTGDLSVAGNVSGRDFTLASREGNLQITGDLSGRRVTLSTRADGDIMLAGNMTASHLVVSAGGDITQTAGVLGGGDLYLSTNKGNIGSAGNAVKVDADYLSASTGRHGSVNVSALGDLTLDNSHSGRNFTLSATGTLTAGDVVSDDGSIYLSSTGSMQVERGATILAGQGNLTLLNTESQKGTITIGKNATLMALSDSLSNGLGNVYIAIGAVPANPVKGSKPGNLGLSQLYGGKAYFGTNGITVQGNKNQVDAWGSNVVFSTGSRPASAIVLSGGVLILADPPVSTAGPAAVLQPVTTKASQPVLPLFNASSSFFQPVLLNQATMSLPALPTEKGVVQIIDNNADEILKPVACVTAVTNTAASRALSLKNVVESNQKGTFYARGASYEVDASTVTFRKGEILINASSMTRVELPCGDAVLAPGTCAIIKSDGDNIEIYNLCESHLGGIKVTMSNSQFVLSAGQRLVAGQSRGLAVRNESTHRLANNLVKVAEFPFMSLISSSDLLSDLMHSNMKQDRQLKARLLKMAACLALVTTSHGSFKN